VNCKRERGERDGKKIKEGKVGGGGATWRGHSIRTATKGPYRTEEKKDSTLRRGGLGFQKVIKL